MKFYGIPNMLVKEKRKQPFTGRIIYKHLFRFNENGEFETDDPRLIKKLKKKFKFEEDKKYKCKKCSFECDNKGELLAHYKHEHSRG